MQQRTLLSFSWTSTWGDYWELSQSFDNNSYPLAQENSILLNNVFAW